MHKMPLRLKAKRTPLLQRPPEPGADDGSWTEFLPSRGVVLRRFRAIRRGLLVLLWTLLCILVQALLLLLPGPAKIGFARLYWAGMSWLIGVKVRMIGAPAMRVDGRPVVYVSNHSSWLDILVLGGRLNGCFVAKNEVIGWPVVGLIARLGRTVYVRRRRTSTGRERDAMQARLAAGDGLILFPEGTTSDGSRVMPFRSAFLSIATQPITPGGQMPIVQPVSVVYDRLGGLPTGRTSRPIFAWYGDMDIGSHFWRLAQYQGLRATVLLHTPLDPARFADRKALAHAAWVAVAEGASSLRQNRPARPVTAPGSLELPETGPMYA
jgi:1-acyl-sn-glycerol-3-phosphate acyltransferase